MSKIKISNGDQHHPTLVIKKYKDITKGEMFIYRDSTAHGSLMMKTSKGYLYVSNGDHYAHANHGDNTEFHIVDSNLQWSKAVL